MAQNPGQTGQSNLDTYDKDSDGKAVSLDRDTKEFSLQLEKLGAKEGAKRLEWVRQEFHRLSIDEAYEIIRPEEVVAEAENATLRHLGWLHVVRNILSVLPIMLTWFALGLAAVSYQRDLATKQYQNDLYQPFLKLWQEGFHGTDRYPFSVAAFVDFSLLLGLITLVICIPVLEALFLQRKRRKLEDFFPLVKRILVAIGIAGVHTTLHDEDVARITQAIERVFNNVLLRHDQLVDEARDFVKDTKLEMQKISTEFRGDLATFNNDVRLLEHGLKDLGNNLISYDQKLKDLTDASVRLASSSVDLAKNAGEMAVSADKSAQASQGINNQLSSLNATQQQVATTIQQAQSDVVKEISSVADDIEASSKDTRDAARELERVATNLGQITQADLQQMTNQVTDMANLVAMAANTLNQVNAQLQGTTQALNAAAQTLAYLGVAPPRRKRSLIKRLLRIP